MRKEEEGRRFSPGQWVTMRDTGAHVKVEAWSTIAGVYRVHSRKNGLQFAGAEEVEPVAAHPDAHLGKFWSRCHAPGCGAPLTPGLATCAKCGGLTCTCGRCQCPRTPSTQKGKRKKAEVAAS
ncbi:MAG: hypothetical protein HY270_22300 [Deltaproteobacteria bacterium]|nr:hypothetical protein [Deltaproteobacteria bacterium]